MKPFLHGSLPIVACCLLSAPTIQAQQPTDERIRRVFADWDKRREALQRIRYTVKGQSIIPKGSFTDDITGLPLVPPNPPEDIAQRQDSMCLIDINGKRFRLEMDCELYDRYKKELFPRVSTATFDSKSFATELPRAANNSSVSPRKPSDPDVFIHRNYARYHPLDAVNRYYLGPLLLAHGLVPRYLDPADFTKQPDAADFVVHGWHVFAGRQCLVLRSYPERSGDSQTSFDEYWVDTGRGSVVVRQTSFVNDKPIIDIEIVSQQTSHGWLPLRWTGTTRRRDQPINVTRLRVEQFAADPPVDDTAFKPNVKPGMNIVEMTYEDPEKLGNQPPGFRFPSKTFHVAPDGDWNEVVNGVEQQNHPWLWYALVGLLALLAAAVGVWYVRHRRPQRGGATMPAV
jgi:hypothetical protein